MAGKVRPGIEPHMTNIFGETASDFARAHVGGGSDGLIGPLVRQIVGLHAARMLDHDDNGRIVRQPFRTQDPGALWNAADADATGIHEIQYFTGGKE